MDERSRNRAQYPEIARFVDQMRSAFGRDVKVVALSAANESS